MSSEQFADLVTLAVAVSSVIVALAAVVSGAYIRWIYANRKEEALFLALLVRICSAVALGAAIVLGYLAWALAFGGLGRPWGAVIIAAPFFMMLSVPIQVALLWRRERRLVPLTARTKASDDHLLAAIEKVGEKADAAYHEANSVNEKIASLDQRLVEQGERDRR